MTKKQAVAAAPGSPTFELHTWDGGRSRTCARRCMRTVWGQSVQVFADSNDAGRDGAFYGIWHDPPGAVAPGDAIEGPFVVQCKHTKHAGATLPQSASRTSSPRSRRWSNAACAAATC